MNTENTKRIIDACPSLFETIEDEQRRMSNEELFSPIAFYFECGDGWTDLLVDLCKKIQAHAVTLPEGATQDIVALQVKEKYGTLRFYLSVHDDTLENLVKEAEERSACTCETCGKPGTLRGAMWMYTACDEHTRVEDRDVVEAP